MSNQNPERFWPPHRSTSGGPRANTSNKFAIFSNYSLRIDDDVSVDYLFLDSHCESLSPVPGPKLDSHIVRGILIDGIMQRAMNVTKILRKPIRIDDTMRLV
jgi:hypothetical protein